MGDKWATEPALIDLLVDARDSKSRFLGSMGSIPIAGTFLLTNKLGGFGGESGYDFLRSILKHGAHAFVVSGDDGDKV